ncbi:hypothetical protein Tco_1449647 [Tanacetum coccineum]
MHIKLPLLTPATAAPLPENVNTLSASTMVELHTPTPINSSVDHTKNIIRGTNTTQIKSSKALPKLKMSSEFS